LACTLVVAACRKEARPGPAKPRRVITKFIPEDASREQERVTIRPNVPNVVEKSLLGTALAADGTVSAEKTVFTLGQPVSLTIWLKESPAGLSTGATWYGAHDVIIGRQKQPMNGSKVATFTFKDRLAVGKYRVEGLWGGNVVADKTFEVTAPLVKRK